MRIPNNLRDRDERRSVRSTPKCLYFCACLFLFFRLSGDVSAQVTIGAAGPDAASITAARDAFRSEIGGGTVAGANGSFGGVRREINWDGVPAQFSAPNNLPPNFFNVNSPRGVIYSTPGTGFQVSGATTDSGAGQPAPANFGNINATYSTTFETFSPQRLFTALNSNITDVTFFLPGTNTPANVRAFGAIFTDVDNAGGTTIQFFDAGNNLLDSFNVLAANNGLSFLGVSYSGPVVARVRITSGNAALGSADAPPGTDVVAMDDFIYAEPAVADVSVVKTGPTTANAPGTVIYTIALTNNGPGDAADVLLTDAVPADTTAVAFSQNTGPAFALSFTGVSFQAFIANFAAGATATFTVVFSINRNVLNGSVLTNGASVTSLTPDSNSANNIATATTPITNTGPHVVISEFRLRGPSGDNDEFVEIYNDSNSPLTVQATDLSGGWAIRASDGGLRCTIPNGTIIPARGHFLCANAVGYSLSGYPGGISVNAVPDDTYTIDIFDGAAVAVFTSTTTSSGLTLLDVVGFSGTIGSLTREGIGLNFVPVATNTEHSFVRKLVSGIPQDTNDNAADFVLVATSGNAPLSEAQLGAPGPENLSAPTQRNATVKASLIEPLQLSSASPNRVRDLTPVTNGSLGTLSIRRRFTNNTGAIVNRLRFRLVNITTRGTPISTPPQADLRLFTSGDFAVSTSLGALTVRGTLVEQPPAQPLGGGLNSSASLALPGGALAPGAAIDLQFLLGVQATGTFRFFVNVEGLTNPPTSAPGKSGRKLFASGNQKPPGDN